eukprot:733722-Pleurochrysis_carterae.AAC.3
MHHDSNETYFERSIRTNVGDNCNARTGRAYKYSAFVLPYNTVDLALANSIIKQKPGEQKPI